MSHALPYWRLSGFYFCYFAFLGAFTPYFGLYLKSLALPAIEIASLMALPQFMRIVSPGLWGWLSDRRGVRMPIVRGVSVAALACYLGIFFADGFVAIGVVIATMAFFWSASLPLVEAATLSHLRDRPSFYTRIRAWGSIGFIVAVVGIGYVLDAAGIAALLWVVLLAKAGIVLFASRVPEAPPEPHAADGTPVIRVLARPAVVALLTACFLMAVAQATYYTFYSIWLVDHGWTKSTVGWLWALGVLAEIAIFMLMPRLLRRFSLTAILAASLGCGVVRFATIGWGVDVPALIVAAQLLHAATFGSFHAASVAAIHRHFRGRHQATGQALYSSLSMGGGGTVGGIAAGAVWAAAPEWAWGTSALATLVGMAVVLAVRVDADNGDTRGDAAIPE